MPTSLQSSKSQRNAPKQRQEYPLLGFGGLNNNDDPAAIDDVYSPDTLNTVLDSKGAIAPRKGYTKLLTTSLGAATYGGYPFYKSDGTKQLVFAWGSTLARYDNAGGSVTIASSYTANQDWDFDEYNDLMYAANGTDALQQYNGSTITGVAGLGTPPQFIRVHKNRLWYATKNSSRIYFSDAGNPTSFPANNYFDVNTNDGQTITALEVTLDSLIIFKTDSIWIVTGEPIGAGTTTQIGNLNQRRANSDVGCVSFRTVKKIEGGVLLFMARSGIYVFENYASRLISQNINNTFRLDLNPNFQARSYAIYSPVEKKYLVGYPDNTSTVPNKMICYDMVVKQFTIWDHIPGGWGINFRFSQVDSVVIGDPATGNLYTLFQGYADIAGDNGTITSATSTTLVNSSATWTTSQFVGARVEVGLGTANYYYATVTANTGTTLTVASWTGGTPSAGQVYTIGGYNSYWKTKIFDFDNPAISKRYKYFKIFTNSEASYNLQVGVALGYAPLKFDSTLAVSLSSGSATWDHFTWDAGIYWDSKSSLFKQVPLPGQDRFIQLIFGNFNASQPWRVSRGSITYKPKKARAS